MATTDDYLDTTIMNLKVISWVPKNGKLCVRKGQLAIERQDTVQPLRRWLCRDSRDVVLMHVRNTVYSALKLSRTLSADAWILERLTQELASCEAGLQNLKATYTADSTVVAGLDVLIDRIRAAVGHGEDEAVAQGGAS